MLYKLKSFHVTFKAASTVHSEEQVLTQVLGDKRCYLEAFWSKISLFVFFIVKHTYNKVITLNIFNVLFSEWHEVSSRYCAAITTFHLQNSFIFLNWNYIHFLIPLPPSPSPQHLEVAWLLNWLVYLSSIYLSNNTETFESRDLFIFISSKSDVISVLDIVDEQEMFYE